MLGVGHTGVGRLRHRPVYPDVAGRGLSIFDLTGKQNEALREDWRPVLRYIEHADTGLQAQAAGASRFTLPPLRPTGPRIASPWIMPPRSPSSASSRATSNASGPGATRSDP